MKFKICFNKETHKISKAHNTLKGLKDLISAIFISELPKSWKLEYVDAESNKVVLEDEEDYQRFINSQQIENKNSTYSLKIYILPVSQSSGASENLAESEAKEWEVFDGKESKESREPVAVTKKVLDELSPREKYEQKTEAQQQVESVQPVLDDQTTSQGQEKESKNKSSEIPHVKNKSNAQKATRKSKTSKSQTKSQLIPLGEQQVQNLVSRVIEKSVPKIASILSQSQHFRDSHTNSHHARTLLLHYRVRCDGCNTLPILGNRYKCSICPDFDFCETCEQTKSHPHAFIKIRFPSQPYLHRSMIDSYVVAPWLADPFDKIIPVDSVCHQRKPNRRSRLSANQENKVKQTNQQDQVTNKEKGTPKPPSQNQEKQSDKEKVTIEDEAYEKHLEYTKPEGTEDKREKKTNCSKKSTRSTQNNPIPDFGVSHDLFMNIVDKTLSDLMSLKF